MIKLTGLESGDRLTEFTGLERRDLKTVILEIKNNSPKLLPSTHKSRQIHTHFHQICTNPCSLTKHPPLLPRNNS